MAGLSLVAAPAGLLSATAAAPAKEPRRAALARLPRPSGECRAACAANDDAAEASAKVAAAPFRGTTTRRTSTLVAFTAVLLALAADAEVAQAAGRRKPPPPKKEKEDTEGLSAYEAKLLAKLKRREAMKESVAAKRAQGSGPVSAAGEAIGDAGVAVDSAIGGSS
eukprot:SM000311S11923  [mRNA]  locus=s311:120989:121833:- [translate_table: standard]